MVIFNSYVKLPEGISISRNIIEALLSRQAGAATFLQTKTTEAAPETFSEPCLEVLRQQRQVFRNCGELGGSDFWLGNTHIFRNNPYKPNG